MQAASSHSPQILLTCLQLITARRENATSAIQGSHGTLQPAHARLYCLPARAQQRTLRKQAASSHSPQILLTHHRLIPARRENATSAIMAMSGTAHQAHALCRAQLHQQAQPAQDAGQPSRQILLTLHYRIRALPENATSAIQDSPGTLQPAHARLSCLPARAQQRTLRTQAASSHSPQILLTHHRLIPARRENATSAAAATSGTGQNALLVIHTAGQHRSGHALHQRNASRRDAHATTLIITAGSLRAEPLTDGCCQAILGQAAEAQITA